jgi:hypothetical protein
MQSQVRASRNPFGVMDVPDPDGPEVAAFAAAAMLDGSADDANAQAWATAVDRDHGGIEGDWASRWNGGVDPTIPGDGKEKWKQGQGEVKIVGERVYLLFDWQHGTRRGLIDARHEGANRLVGKYINLTDPKTTRPWIGLIVDDSRIDGRWPGGRLDFRR